MTLSVRIQCDKPHCVRKLVVNAIDAISTALTEKQWRKHPAKEGVHYCPSCYDILFGEHHEHPN